MHFMDWEKYLVLNPRDTRLENFQFIMVLCWCLILKHVAQAQLFCRINSGYQQILPSQENLLFLLAYCFGMGFWLSYGFNLVAWGSGISSI